MNKRIAGVIAAAMLCAVSTGCSGDKNSGNTQEQPLLQQSAAQTTAAPIQSNTEIAEQTQQASEENTSAQTQEAEPPTQQPQTEQSTSEAEAVQSYAPLVAGFGNEYLGLPQLDKVYIFQDKAAQTEIDGTVCHAVSCYDEHEGTLYFMCDYYVTEDGVKVYRYYESEDRYVLLPESTGFPLFDPSTQTPEEIFRNANELHALLCGRFDAVDLASPIRDDSGAQYYPITDERFDTMPELLEAVSRYFSDEIINAYMETGIFRTDDAGRLCRKSIAVENPTYAGTVYELSTLDGETATFVAYSTFMYEAGETAEKEYTFTAVKQYGVWKFTVFPSVYS